MKENARHYSHGVNTGGSGDGNYCIPCDDILIKSGTDPLHKAYRKVQSLRHEAEGFYEAFSARRKQAEAEVERLNKERNR